MQPPEHGHAAQVAQPGLASWPSHHEGATFMQGAPLHMAQPGPQGAIPLYVHTYPSQGHAVAIDPSQAMIHQALVADPSQMPPYTYQMAAQQGTQFIPVSSSLPVATMSHAMPQRPVTMQTTGPMTVATTTAPTTPAVPVVSVGESSAQSSGLRTSKLKAQENPDPRDRHKEIERWRENVTNANQRSTSPPSDPSNILIQQRDKANAASAASNEATRGTSAAPASSHRRKRHHHDSNSPGTDQSRAKMERKRADVDGYSQAIPVALASTPAAEVNAEHVAMQKFSMPVLPQVASNLPGLLPMTAAASKTTESKARMSGKPRSSDKAARGERSSPPSAGPIDPGLERTAHMYNYPFGSITEGKPVAMPETHSHVAVKREEKRKLRGAPGGEVPDHQPVERRLDHSGKRSTPAASHHRQGDRERDSREYLESQPRLAEIGPDGAVVAPDGIAPLIRFPSGAQGFPPQMIYPYVVPPGSYIPQSQPGLAASRSAPTTNTVYSTGMSQPIPRPSSQQDQEPPPMEPSASSRPERKKRSQDGKRPSDEKSNEIPPSMAYAQVGSAGPTLQILPSGAALVTNPGHLYEPGMSTDGRHSAHPSYEKQVSHGRSADGSIAPGQGGSEHPAESSVVAGKSVVGKMVMYKPTTMVGEGGEAEVKLVQEHVNPGMKKKPRSKKHSSSMQLDNVAEVGTHTSSASNIHMKAMGGSNTTLSPHAAGRTHSKSPALAPPPLASIPPSSREGGPTKAPTSYPNPAVPSSTGGPAQSASKSSGMEGGLSGVASTAIAMPTAAGPYIYQNWIHPGSGWDLPPQQMSAYHAQAQAQQFMLLQQMAIQQQQQQQPPPTHQQPPSSKAEPGHHHHHHHHHHEEKYGHSKSQVAGPVEHSQKHQSHDAAGRPHPSSSSKATQPPPSSHGTALPASYPIYPQSDKKPSDSNRRTGSHHVSKESSRGPPAPGMTALEGKVPVGSESWMKPYPAPIPVSQAHQGADRHPTAVQTSVIPASKRDADSNKYTSRSSLHRAGSQSNLHGFLSETAVKTEHADRKPTRSSGPPGLLSAPPTQDGRASPKDSGRAKNKSRSSHRHTNPLEISPNLVVTRQAGREAYPVEPPSGVVQGTWMASPYYSAAVAGIDWTRQEQLVAEVANMEGMSEDMKEHMMHNLTLQQINHAALQDPNDVICQLTKMYTQVYGTYDKLREELESAANVSEEGRQRLQNDLHKCLADLQHKHQVYSEHVNLRYAALMTHYKNAREAQAKASTVKSERVSSGEKASHHAEAYEHYPPNHHKDRDEKSHIKREPSGYDGGPDSKVPMLVDSKHVIRKADPHAAAHHPVSSVPVSLIQQGMPGWSPATAGLAAANAGPAPTATVYYPAPVSKTVSSISGKGPDGPRGAPLEPIASVVNEQFQAWPHNVAPLMVSKAAPPIPAEGKPPHERSDVDVSVLAGAEALLGMASGQFTPGKPEQGHQPTTAVEGASFQVRDVLPDLADPEQHFLRTFGRAQYSKPSRTPEQAVVGKDDQKPSSKPHPQLVSPPQSIPALRVVSPTNSNTEIDVVTRSDQGQLSPADNSLVEDSEEEKPDPRPLLKNVSLSPRKPPLEPAIRSHPPQPTSVEDSRTTDAALCLTSLGQQALPHTEKNRGFPQSETKHVQDGTQHTPRPDSRRSSASSTSAKATLTPHLPNGRGATPPEQSPAEDNAEKNVQKLAEELAEAKRRCKEKEQELEAHLKKARELQRESESVDNSDKPNANKKWPSGRKLKRKSPDIDTLDGPERTHMDGVKDLVRPPPSKRSKGTLLVETHVNPEKRIKQRGRPKRDEPQTRSGSTKSSSKSHTQGHEPAVKSKHGKRGGEINALPVQAPSKTHPEDFLSKKDPQKSSSKTHHDAKVVSPSKKLRRKHKKSKDRKQKHGREIHGKVHRSSEETKRKRPSPLKTPEESNSTVVMASTEEDSLSPVYEKTLPLPPTKDTATVKEISGLIQSGMMSQEHLSKLRPHTTDSEKSAVVAKEAAEVNSEMTTSPILPPEGKASAQRIASPPLEQSSDSEEEEEEDDEEDRPKDQSPAKASPPVSPTLEEEPSIDAASPKRPSLTQLDNTIAEEEEHSEKEAESEEEQMEVDGLSGKQAAPQKAGMDEGEEEESTSAMVANNSGNNAETIQRQNQEDSKEEVPAVIKRDEDEENDMDTSEGTPGQLVIDCSSNDPEEPTRTPGGQDKLSSPNSSNLDQKIDELGTDILPLWNRPSTSPPPPLSPPSPPLPAKRSSHAAKSNQMPYQLEVEDISSPESASDAPLTIDEDALGDSGTPLDEQTDHSLGAGCTPMDVDNGPALSRY